MNVFKLFVLFLSAKNSVNAYEIDCSYINKFIETCYCIANITDEGIQCRNIVFANNTLTDFGVGLTVKLSIHELLIQNTNIVRIESNAFSRFFVEELVIYNNAFLQNIDKNAFTGEIKGLYLYNNQKLSQENIFVLTSNLLPTERIDIMNSGLKILPANAFGSNSKVKYIDLNTNSIEILPNNDVFKSLIGLRYLDLSKNKISKIDALVFDSPLMETIDLSYNMLTENSFEYTIISMLSKDVTLDLKENHFTTLTQPIFEHLINQTRNILSFGGNIVNQFQCDFRMQWIQSYPNNFENIWCENLNKSLFDVSFPISDFTCANISDRQIALGCICASDICVICVNNSVAFTTNIKSIGKKLNEYNEKFEYLVIAETNLEVIDSKSFGANITFNSLGIANNSKLKMIERNAINLQTIYGLYIVNNTILSDGLIDFVSDTEISADKLTEIYLSGNRLTKIPTNSFYSEKFNNLKFLTLDAQHIDGLAINQNAFGLLPKLEELNLSSNLNLQLSENAVNLSATLNSYGHVDVNITNCNITQWNSKFIAQPVSEQMGVYLNLVDNPIGDNLDFEQFRNFFSYERNRLFISNALINCECDKVKPFLLLNINDTRVNGLVCDNTDICLNAY